MGKIYSLDLRVPVAEVDREPRSYLVEATEEERMALVARFELVRLDSLSAEVRVWNGGNEEGIHVEGHIRASLAQRCVTTLATVDEELDTPFELILVDPETADQMDADEAYLDPEIPDYDALEGNEIALGEIVAQTLSISMDPYPRAADAALDVAKSGHVAVNEPELEKPNPFAVLQKLRDES